MTNIKLGNKMISALLALAMVIAMIPVISGEAYASSVETFDFSSVEGQQKVGSINGSGLAKSITNDSGIINISIKDDGYSPNWYFKNPGLEYLQGKWLQIYGYNSELQLTADEGYTIKEVKFILQRYEWANVGFQSLCDDEGEYDENNYEVSPKPEEYSFYAPQYDDYDYEDEVEAAELSGIIGAYESYKYPQGTSEFKLSCDRSRWSPSIKAIEVTYDTADADDWNNQDVITPEKTSIKSLKSCKKSVRVSWATKTDVTGYQILYKTTKSKTKHYRIVTVKSATVASKTISNLKRHTRYYIKVRTYSGNTSNHSDWSKVRSVKTK